MGDFQEKNMLAFKLLSKNKNLKLSFYALVLRIYKGGNFLSGKITLPRGTETGLGKIKSLTVLVMLFSPNQSQFPLVKY